MDGGVAGDFNKSPHQFEVLGRDFAYSGWRKIVKKTVRVKNEKNYVFDVVHQVSDCFYACRHGLVRVPVYNDLSDAMPKV